MKNEEAIGSWKDVLIIAGGAVVVASIAWLLGVIAWAVMPI